MSRSTVVRRGGVRLLLAMLVATLSGLAGPALASAGPASSVAGIDVSAHQGQVGWQYWWDRGVRFAYIKATEGTGYHSPMFSPQSAQAAQTGMLHGAYHYAVPNRSSGAQQATYFLEHGGAWSPDGHTLPGALDLEHNPYGPVCYGLNQQQMSGWIADFSETYYARTGRHLILYTNAGWWNQCVGATFTPYTDTHPLWLAQYAERLDTLPTGWSQHTFWQHTTTPLDQDRFTGTYRQLHDLATG